MRSGCIALSMPEPAEIDAAALLAPPPAELLDGASLFLDFDGTLVEIAERPDAVAVDARLSRLVRGLTARLDGRIAIVSGRGADEIDALFGSAGLAIGGSHGAELRRGRAVEAPARPAALDDALERMRAFAATTPGLLVEAKPLGAGLHFRGAPQAAEACRAFAGELAEATGLTLQQGKMVFELRAPGDKGAAIAALMALPPFAGSRPVFLGDDLTDEPGFAAAARLGGAGVLVGPIRATAADYRLPGVSAVLEWLEAFAGNAA